MNIEDNSKNNKCLSPQNWHCIEFSKNVEMSPESPMKNARENYLNPLKQPRVSFSRQIPRDAPFFTSPRGVEYNYPE